MSRRPPRRPRARARPAASARAVLAAILGLLSAAASAADFGRVFFSPAERSALTRLRDHPLPAAAPEPVVVAPVPQRLDGILRRPDGRSIVWIDGQPQVSPAGYRLPPGRALTLIPDDSPTTHLRVGDSWPRSGEDDARWPRIAVQVPPEAGR